MEPTIFLFDPVERFVTGTVGEPGERTFFLQARTGNRLISVSIEKAQVAALAERIAQIVKEVRVNEPLTVIDRVSSDDLALETPIDEEFRVGAIGLAFLADRKLIEIDFRSIESGEGEVGESFDITSSINQIILRVVISLGYAESFVKRSNAIIAAGRRPCPFCGGPIDPVGHLCPRANGYRR